MNYLKYYMLNKRWGFQVMCRYHPVLRLISCFDKLIQHMHEKCCKSVSLQYCGILFKKSGIYLLSARMEFSFDKNPNS